MPAHPRVTDLSPDRVEVAYWGLRLGWRKSKIKKALKEKFNIGFRGAQDIIAAAQKRRAAELLTDPEAAKAEVLTFLDSTMADEGENTRNRLRAAETQAKLLGFVAPEQHQVNVTVSLDDVVADLEQKRRAGEIIDVEPVAALPAPEPDVLPVLPIQTEEEIELEEIEAIVAEQEPRPVLKPVAPAAKPASPKPAPKPAPKPKVSQQGPVSWDDDDLCDEV
jgi:hypothetical protein